MSVKHTKGPWRIEIINERHVHVVSENMPTWKTCFPHTSSVGPIDVCDFKSPESPSMRDYDEAGAKLLLDTNLANARLISA